MHYHGLTREKLSGSGDRQGFSLIELLVVAALIIIITALALPNLVRSRFSANEASATSSLRLIHNLENQYAGTYNSFSPDLDSLGPQPAGTQPTATSADLADTIIC